MKLLAGAVTFIFTVWICVLLVQAMIASFVR